MESHQEPNLVITNLEGGKSRACGLLDPLVAVKNPFEKFGHQGLQKLLVWLLDNPVTVPANRKVEKEKDI